MSYLCFDIETAESQISEATSKMLFESITPDARLKDEAKILESIEKKKQKIVENLPLTFYGAQITAIGFLDPEKNAVFYQDEDGRYGEEDIIKISWDYLSEALGSGEHHKTLVTYNGKSFDIPLLLFRSALYEIYPSVSPQRLLTSPYENIVHCDLLNFLKEGSMHFWLTVFGYTDFDSQLVGSDMPKLFKERKCSLIRDHLLDDLKALEFLYKRLRAYLP